ncbi:MAG: hypothetical protein K2J15_06395, partial [Muribaculaceae bacterium]|nr:hypothetical protein [Muribaculaceae bacterium]
AHPVSLMVVGSGTASLNCSEWPEGGLVTVRIEDPENCKSITFIKAGGNTISDDIEPAGEFEVDGVGYVVFRMPPYAINVKVTF